MNRELDTVQRLEAKGPEDLLPFRPGADGGWSRTLAAHLARRCGFGMPPAVVARFERLGPDRAVGSLLEETSDGAASLGLLSTAMAVNEIEPAQAWWIHQMLRGENPLREKVALFWHGHFATSNRKVGNPRLMLDQINLFRRRGLGGFGDLVRAVARDPAMLIWLDGNSNRAGKPNENFAREVMELFTLGIGNYTEKDIKEAARAFTGWHVRGGTTFWFNERAHDAGEKRVLGRTVRTGDDVVNACVEQPASARLIARKLFEYFVHPAPGEELIGTLAGIYEKGGRNIGRYLGVLLRSRLFYGEAARRAIISSPVDFAIGTIRTLEAQAAPARLAPRLRDMGQDLLRPPNVKGWDGGRTWISSTSILARLKFTIDLVAGDPIEAKVAWDRIAAGARTARDAIVGRCFPEGIGGPVAGALERVTAADDPKRTLAAVMQLPEYQMI